MSSMKKNIWYSPHAISRKLERDITDNDISIVLGEPDYTLSSFDERKIAVKKITSKLIHVVYKEEKTHINIITVY